MSEEEIKKIAKEEFMNNVMENLDSALIFTYIQNLEQKLQQKESIIKEIYTKANDTSITSLDLRQYILDNLGGNK